MFMGLSSGWASSRRRSAPRGCPPLTSSSASSSGWAGVWAGCVGVGCDYALRNLSPSHPPAHPPTPPPHRDYNEYVLRNLSRGYSRKDLGLSLLKEKRIKASEQMKQLSQRMRTQRLQVGGGPGCRWGASGVCGGGGAR